MANAVRSGLRSVRALTLLGAVLLLGGLTRPPSPARGQDTPAPSKPARPSATGSDLAEIVPFINKQIAEQWAANKLTPSARCTDHEFLRRAFLDLLGRIARPEEIKRYMAEPTETRRAQLINRLLGDEDAAKKTKYGQEYAKHFADMWTVWLLTRSGATDGARSVYHGQMHLWLQEQFAANKSFKDIVSELLTATGKTNENGAVNYLLAHLGEPIPANKQAEEGQFEMVPVTSRTTRLFLGIQTQCTQCHDHPFNPEWKQHHFWGVNAFFRQVKRAGRPPAMNNRAMTTVMDLEDNPNVNRDGIVFYEKRNGQLLSTKPVFLDGTRLDREQSGTRRQQLALLITRSEYFPKAYVNRMWGHFFGRGFTNPVDDFGEHNPVSHPELLDELAKKFVAYGYDAKRLIRWICNSEAYSLSSVANRTNDKQEADPFFARMLLKAMTPEQLFESLMVATQADMRMKPKERSDLRDSWMKNLIVNFGDDEGNEVTFNGTVVQALLLMNGKDINEAVTSKERGTVALAYSRHGGGAGCLTDLYLAALNRPPTAMESQKILGILRSAPVKHRDALSPWQDVFWALLNSNEFILNH
jgi:Protein of unknown function (DUF1549)/Protein of unknown function (DUF1553)